MVLKSYALATLKTDFPYIPGFLGFKEVPALLKVWDLILNKPDNNTVYVSAGYLITQAQSLEIIKNCIGNYRIPEPTRNAHETVNAFRLGDLKAGYHEVNQPLTLF